MDKASLIYVLKALVSNGIPESCIYQLKYTVNERKFYYSLEPSLDVDISFSFSANDPKIKEILFNLQNKKLEDKNET